MNRPERYRNAIEYFRRVMPSPETELHYKNPYQLMVSVILSAQCTDKRVNLITPAFFQQFPDAQSLAVADAAEVFRLISSCSYPNNKTKHLIGMAVALIELFDGVVPSEVNDLQTLPGVGRKTANVIASVCFNKPAMAVDTHVFRVSERIGLTTNAKTPAQAEKQLVKNTPAELIPHMHHWLILHGRYVCKARKPDCHKCGLSSFCRYYKKKR